jgi:arylsulfatase A-like enzyme
MRQKALNFKNLIIPVCSSLILSTSVEAQKNVLFLIADDFNYWTGAQGYHPGAHTPVLDKLAEKGVMFTNAMCSSPVCVPSRNAFMSGYRPSTTGITTNQGGYVRDINGFSNIVSLHQYFKENGYYTLGAGKLWHPGSMGSRITDPDNWTELITDPSGCNGGTYRRYEGSQYSWSGNTNSMNRNNCNDYNLALKIAEKISNYHLSEFKDKPFFIGCGLFRPHAPFHSPKQFWDLLDDEKMKPGPGVHERYTTGTEGTSHHLNIIRDGVWNDGIQSYLASMALTDYNIGIILNALENSPMRDNTIVVFFGDHGFDLGEHGRWGKFAKNKSANHTTLIIYDPSARGNGQKCHIPVTLQALYPTLVEITGLPPKQDIEGVSLAHLLNCPQEENWPHPALMTYSNGHYIMYDGWYFIENGNNSELYNDNEDPYQWNNIFGQPAYNEIVASLRAKIDSTVLIGTKMRQDLISFGNVRPENYNPQRPLEESSCVCEDDIPPTTPGSAMLNESSARSLDIYWMASTDNVAVTGYEVYVDGRFNHTASDTIAQITGLECDTEYAIKIRAFDDCPNYSAFSEEVMLSTEECIAYKVPGVIQAEAYYDMMGVEIQSNEDNGDGMHLGSINSGNLVTYHIEVPAIGQYMIDFRVASGSQGGTIQILIDDVLKSFVFIPGSGGWQNWKTISHELTLNEGVQKLTLRFSGSDGYLFNLNWIEVRLMDTNVQIANIQEIRYLLSNVADEYGILQLDMLFSDPVVKLEVIDLAGRVVQSDLIPGEHERWEYQLSKDLKPGMYFLRINNHVNPAVEKFLIM